MANRRRQIELLLATRFDYDPLKTQRFDSTKAKTTKATGKRPSRFKPCERCGGYEVWRNGIRYERVSGRGHNTDRFGRQNPCEACNGKGNVPWDDMTNEQVVTADENPSLGDLIRRDTRQVTCPDCQDLRGVATGEVHGSQCRRCEGTGLADIAGSWLSAPTIESDGYRLDAFTAAIIRRDQAGSYHELDLALAGISRHVNKPLEYQVLTDYAQRVVRLLDDVFLPPTTRELADLSTFDLALVDLAFRYLDSRMPDPIRVPGDVIANARLLRDHRPAKGRVLNQHQRRLRDKQIRSWAREGRPYPWIRQQTGLSDRQLREIINGAKEHAA